MPNKETHDCIFGCGARVFNDRLHNPFCYLNPENRTCSTCRYELLLPEEKRRDCSVGVQLAYPLSLIVPNLRCKKWKQKV